MKYSLVFMLISIFLSTSVISQIDQSKVGAWYMYFFNTTFKDSPWGVQGDVQHRNWNFGGDLEQLLVRGGLTYKPKNANVKLTLGYGDVTTGTFGPDNSTSRESRMYQEALVPVKISGRFYMNNRFRYEQRFVENQNFRTRYRYNLFLNVGLTSKEMKKKTLYLALYNEIFVNGQRTIGENKSVEIFDRNRFYAAFGYYLKDNLKVQLGIMNQLTNNWKSNQLQFSLHHKIN
jgi:hypothetical protein